MIRFGTSGWRAVISDGFTFENVRRVARAVATLVGGTPGAAERGIAVGYDTRFLGENFAAEVARVLQGEGVTAHLATSCLPTPVLAFAVIDGARAGGLNVTASHNPPEYSGLKFSTADGAPAPPEVTSRIEQLIESASGGPAAPDAAAPQPLDPRSGYFGRLADLVRPEPFSSRRLRVAVDPRYGTSRGWLDRCLEDLGVEVIRIHDWRDPLFGGGSPDCSGANLDVLRRTVVENSCDLGLATDGDGDRFGVVDRDGSVVSPNLVLALLVDHLADTRGWSEGVGRTVATTHLIDRVAESRGFPVHETPVGFKYFNALLAEGRIFMGAEESAGMSVKGHVPEKDGILAGLLAAEMTASRGRSIAEQAEELYGRVGRVVSRRVDRGFPANRRPELEARTAESPRELAGSPVEREVRMDGVKWIRRDGSWLLIRVSGTEPVVRVYAEAFDAAGLETLLETGLAMVPA